MGSSGSASSCANRPGCTNYPDCRSSNSCPGSSCHPDCGRSHCCPGCTIDADSCSTNHYCDCSSNHNCLRCSHSDRRLWCPNHLLPNHHQVSSFTLSAPEILSEVSVQKTRVATPRAAACQALALPLFPEYHSILQVFVLLADAMFSHGDSLYLVEQMASAWMSQPRLSRSPDLS